MLLSTQFILVKEINSNVPRSNFSDTEIEQLAKSILEVGGVIRPIVVRPTGIDSYEVVEGHLEYHAAARANEINPRDGQTITAFVIEGPKAKAIEEQVTLLNKTETAQEQPQETAQKIVTEPVTADPEKVNLQTAEKDDLQRAFKRYGIKWSRRVWDAIAYWREAGKELTWDNLKKSTRAGHCKIGGYAIGTYSNLLRVGHIPA